MSHNFYYILGRSLIRLYSRLMLKMDVHYHSQLPTGPKLFAPNHPSGTDPFLVHLLPKDHLSVLIYENAFHTPVFGWLIKKCKQIPVSPGKSIAIKAAHKAVEEGRSVAIFPEGDFSPQSGGFHPPRNGAARLALLTRIPVIPVGIYMPRERSLTIRSKITGKETTGYWYLRGPYTMTVGESMVFAGNAENQDNVREVSETIMSRVRTLAYESEMRGRRV